jgi:Domain of unknown function (DUF927)
MKQVTKVSPKTHPSNHKIEFLAVGVSETRGKFLLVAKGENAILSVRNLTRQPTEELERLEALNVDFIVPKARNDFLAEAQEAASMTPTFEVATQIGWSGDVFVTPSGVYPKQAPLMGMPNGWAKIQVHLDAKDEDVHSRFRCHGSPLKSQEIFRLCKGNSRLMFAAALSFVGPICKPFGLRAPGVQAVGDAANGKTVFGIIAGATWGGNPDSTIGFGCAWNGTPNGLEEYPPAHNQTLMVLDETSLMPTDEKGRVLSFGEALMRLKQGQGKKRFNSRVVERWSSPLISTSNFSVFHLLDNERRKNYEAYVDRLIDIPPPDGSSSFFENLHGFKDADAFGLHLFDLAVHNFGHPSRAFLTRFTAELARDRTGLAAVVAGHVAKYKAATDGITSPTRKVQRVRGYFATVYAAGCLAIRYKILPFTEAELFDAIMSCHRDHVAFVDAEVAGGPGRGTAAPSAQGAAAERGIADVLAAVEQLFDRLRRFVNDNRKGVFIDVRKRRDGKPCPAAREGALVLGYIGKHDGRTEYWIPGPVFRKVAGGAREERALKEELFTRGLLATDRRGERVSLVVKRTLPDGSRPNFVVLRYMGRKS